MADTMTKGAEPAGQYSTAYRTYALILLLLVYISNYADRQILGILTEAIKAEFGVSDSAMGLLGGFAFAIFYATLGVPIALLADRSNRRNIIAAATAIWSVMTAVCGLAGSFTQLLVARIGVGVGEAGGSPPAHSIIADLYPREQRATALAIYALGVPLGLVVGLFIGGSISQAYGWRMAFIALGAPGVLLALLVVFTLREPRRGQTDGVAPAAAPPLGTVVRFMWSQRSLRHAIAGATLTTLVGYAGVQWWPPFLMRSHGLSIVDVGLFLALVFGVASAFGTFMGGLLADRLSKRDAKWGSWVVTFAILGSFPFGIAVYLTGDSTLVFALIFIPAMASGLYLAPTFAMVQNLVGVGMRSVAAAILLFTINLIGMGVGPTLAGILSDLLRPDYGADSLRYALLIIGFLNLWAALHYFLAGPKLAADYERARHA